MKRFMISERKGLLTAMMFLSIFGFTNVFAQGFVFPLLQDGKRWNYRYEDMQDHVVYFSEWVDGDSVVNGTLYSKVYAGNEDTVVLSMFMREKGEKVYALLPRCDDKTKMEEVLMYDFGLQGGAAFTTKDNWKYAFDALSYDICTTGDALSLTVATVDTILVKGDLRRRLTIPRDEGDILPYVWVEGIGGFYGLTSPPRWDLATNGKVITFLSCEVNGEVIFTANDFQSPAYTTSVGISSSKKSIDLDNNAPLFDLQGRRIPSGQALPSRHGVFIRDGKKILR